MKVMGAHNPIKHYDRNLYHICLSLSHNKKLLICNSFKSIVFCYYNNTIVTRCPGLVVKAGGSGLVNGNYQLRYWYRPTFRPIPIPKCRFRQFSDISVSAEISARLGTEISAIKNSFLKGKMTTQ
jgi:hypothetical protein